MKASHLAQVRASMRRYNRDIRPTLPKCGARTRVTGEPCRQVAMANGRCCFHGGRTPKGNGWHKPRWPNANAADFEQKLDRKLRDQQRAAKKRAARLAAMTPEERARYDAWHRARKPGPAAARAARRRERKQAVEAAEIMSRERLSDPTVDALQQRIDELRRQISAAEHDIFG